MSNTEVQYYNYDDDYEGSFDVRYNKIIKLVNDYTKVETDGSVKRLYLGNYITILTNLSSLIRDNDRYCNQAITQIKSNESLNIYADSLIKCVEDTRIKVYDDCIILLDRVCADYKKIIKL